MRNDFNKTAKENKEPLDASNKDKSGVNIKNYSKT